MTDSAGDVFTEVTHFTATDHTETPVWSAPITAGGGTRPVITVEPTTATTASGELAIGFCADSGFGGTPAAGAGFTPRIVIGGVGDMDMLLEDASSGAVGATPSSSTSTSARTVWLQATLVFKHQ